MKSRRRRKPRILMVGPGSKAKGGITAVINNYRSSSLWSEFDCHHFSSSSDGPRIRRLAYANWRVLVYMVWLVCRRPDLVVIHASGGLSFYRKFVYLLFGHLLRVPMILHLHPAYFSEFYAQGSEWTRAMIRSAGRWSARIIFLSALQRDAFLTVFPAEKMVVVSNPVNCWPYQLLLKDWQPDPRQVLYLGWIIPAKGVYDLLDAVPAILREFPDARFVFAGPKEVEQLRALVAQRGLDRSVDVPGWVQGFDKLRLLRTSRLLILPSYTEGVPNVILEAMASRLPIVTTPVGGIPSAVTDGVSCLMVKPGDVEGIAAAICALLRDDQKCQQLAEAAYRDVSGNYELETIARQLSGVFSRVMTRSSAS